MAFAKPIGTSSAKRPKRSFAASGAYAALRPARHTIVGGKMVERVSPELEALRAGRPVTVNLFRVPREFRPDGMSPSDPVTVYPDGRIEPW